MLKAAAAKSRGIRRNATWSDYALEVFVYLFCALIFLVTFYPFWNIFIISFNDAGDTMRGSLYFWPRVPTFQSYRVVIREEAFLTSMRVTLLRTVLGTPLTLLVTTMAAYVLTRKNLPGRKGLSLLFIFTMYFGGGLIPYYMVLRTMNLIDTFWVYIVPTLIDTFNIMLVMSYIRGLPDSVEESAKLDGANDLVLYARITMPLCTPIVATIGLFVAIGQWNAWFDSYAFTYKAELQTLQSYLVKVLNQYSTGSMASEAARMADSAKRNPVSSESLRMATTMIATIPILMVYPFVQRFFVKGILVGSIKA